jgi:CBS domain-containing protein
VLFRSGRPRPELFPADLPFPEVLERLKHSQATTFPVVDENGCLVGVFSLSDIRQIMNEQSVGGLVVAGDLGTPQVVTVKPETRLSDALTLFTQKNVNELPVVEDAPPGQSGSPLASKRIRPPRGPVGSKRVLGMLTRQDLIHAYCQRVQELQAAEAQEAQGSTVLKDAQVATLQAVPPTGAHPAVREEEPALWRKRASPAPVAEEEMLKDPREQTAAGETAPPEETPGLPEEPTGTG